MKNIHIIPTDKPSRIYLIKSNNKLGITSNNPEFTENFGCGTQNQHIYITNDVEIKEGDWFIHKTNADISLHKCISRPAKQNVIGNNNVDYFLGYCKKIILTTDQDLINDGVQAIDDKFLDWFVKNPSCEEVEVESWKIDKEWDKEHTQFNPIYPQKTKYKIIIPKEEPKQRNNFYEDLKHYFETTPREKVLEDWNKSAECDNIGPTMEEFLGNTEETLEEAVSKWSLEEAQEFAINKFKSEHKKGIVTWDAILEVLKVGVLTGHKFGAKWQAERMYSEEDWAKSAELDKVGPTMEEFINKSNTPEGLDQFSYDKGLEDGAKWQQERMYSKEDMKACWTACLNFNKPAGFDSGINFDDFIKQFKKK